MIKNFFTFCFLFLSFQIFAQNIDKIRTIANFSNDAEIYSYVEKAKSNGLSLIEVEGLVNAKGASPSELEKLRTFWNAGLVNSSSSVDVLPYSPASSLGNSGNTKITPKASRRFGSNFFENKNISEVPQLFIATPNDYRLGPGDELIINLFGASENTYSVQISRNGTVKFDRIAPVFLSGLSIASAKNRLKNRLSKLYAGLNSNDQLSKVDIDVSLQKARSVIINITGQVTAPGTYTISAFSSILNALFAAGGPNEIGSFRSIKLLRNGKVNKTIDLYDYFVNGIYPSVYMRDQDVILVEAFSKQVDLSTGFKSNGLFELKENETLEHVLNFAGGFSSDSYKEKLFINRINSYSRSIVEISKEKFSNSNLVDGDIIDAKTISTLVENSVLIEGSVYLPGTFDLSAISTVNDLIEAANGLNPSAINKGFLYRSEKGIEDEIISLNFSNSSDLEISLKEQDRITVLSKENLINFNSVTTKGEFIKPSFFELKEGMRVSDVVILSNGFTENADASNVSLYRNISTDNLPDLVEEIKLVFDENYNVNNNLLLQKGDQITVPKISFLRNSKAFSIIGEVSSPGEYVITSEKYSINKALANIEVLRTASLDQIYILRDSLKIPIKGFNNPEFLILDGDQINVPSKLNTIKISGAIAQESILDFDIVSGFKNAISSAGGFSENADKKRAYVIYPNGLKKQTNSFLFIKNYPNIIPGSTIIIPEKVERESKILSEILKITSVISSLASLLAVIKLLN